MKNEPDINNSQINLVNVIPQKVETDYGTKLIISLPKIIISEQGYVDFVNDDANDELIELKDWYVLDVLLEDEYDYVTKKYPQNKIEQSSFDIEIMGVGYNVDDENNSYYYLVINSFDIVKFREQYQLDTGELYILLYGESMPEYMECGMGTLLQVKNAEFSPKI